MTLLDVIAGLFLILFFWFTIWFISGESRLAKLDSILKCHVYNHITYAIMDKQNAPTNIQIDQFNDTTINATTTKNTNIGNKARLLYRFFLRAIKSPHVTSVAFYLFVAYAISFLSVIIYLLCWEVIVSIWVIASITVVMLLLIPSSLSFKAKYKKDDAHNQYNSMHHIKFKYIFPNIRLRVNTCFIKLLNITHSIYKTNSIKSTNNATDNHALHANNLSRDETSGQPKGNDTYKPAPGSPRTPQPRSS
jgi:hypothetical protein